VPSNDLASPRSVKLQLPSTVEEKVEEINESDENPEDKLIKLNEIKEKGLISEEDYNNKKEEILKGM